MALPQQKFREIVFQLLYSYDIGKASAEPMVPLLMKELKVTRKSVKEAQEKKYLILEKLPAIDSMIAQASSGYAFERIQSVERNILRLGTFEILFDSAIPPKVAIAEAVRLARKFGSPESASFVNALLDRIYKTQSGHKVDDAEINKNLADLILSEQISEEASKQAQKTEQDEEEAP